MFDQNEIYEKVLFKSPGAFAQLKSASLVASGTHNQGVRLDSPEGIFFLKLNFDHEKNILLKEAERLEILRKSTYLKVPQTYGS